MRRCLEMHACEAFQIPLERSDFGNMIGQFNCIASCAICQQTAGAGQCGVLSFIDDRLLTECRTIS